MSTNDENKTREIIQNGNEKLETIKFLENQSPNSENSEKNLKEIPAGKEPAGVTLVENEASPQNGEQSVENCGEVIDNNTSNQTLSSECENQVLLENSNSLEDKEILEPTVENSDSVEVEMSRSTLKSRLPSKTSSRSALTTNSQKIPGELSGQPSTKNSASKDEEQRMKYWKSREQELLSKIAELESKVAVKETKCQEPVHKVQSQEIGNDVMFQAISKDKENSKNRPQQIPDKELSYKPPKDISADSNFKNLKNSEEIINQLKVQNEDLRNALAKITTILRDKTTLCISQEKKITALVNQVESLKEVVAITKDLLNIRNMEVQHLSNDITTMEAKIDCERQRHNQMLIKMDEAVKLNSELKKEYENQLKLFQHLRDSYEEKILLLSRDNHPEKKENLLVENGVSNNVNKTNHDSVTQNSSPA